MDQPKVFEFAKKVGLEPIALMDRIRKWGLPVKSHMATLDESTQEVIRQKLDEETSKSKAKKKKVVKKKKVAKKASSKKTTAKKATTTKKKKATKKKTVAQKPTTKKTIAKKAAAKKATTKKKVAKKKTIIRRVAGQTASTEVSSETTTASASGTTTQSAEEVVAKEVSTRGGNIVGKIDLSRVTTASSTSTSASGSNARGITSRATGPRNIRPGFIAPDPISEGLREENERRQKEREEKERKKKAAAKEAPVQSFTASEFRKREVIFQPKKKRVLTGTAKKTQITTPKASKRVVKMHETIKVSDLAQQLGVKAPQLTKKLMAEGVMAHMNTSLDLDTVTLIVSDFGFEVENLHRTEDELLTDVAFGDLNSELVTRSPVVTVMGHVDHGKTTLLDAIRKADVVAGEAGGITQHIGAYSVQLDDGKVTTFIDTPGHEAFTSMRARGANVTDIAIIVVAADDGVMPQTVEAISHAKSAGVPIIVAVNKVDRPGSNPEKIKQQVAEHGLTPEDWGGETIFCEVSALQKQGITELLEQIHLVAEVADLKANPKRSGTGIVIESRVEKGRGHVATLLVQDGTIKVGQNIVAGAVTGRIRTMSNDRGEMIKEAVPSVPVEILGLSETPEAGDRFDICKDEAVAQDLAVKRKEERVQQEEVPNSKMSLEDIFSKVSTGDLKELSVVLKTDVAGSIEAIKGMFSKIENDEVKVKIIHSAVGGVSESDVLLAGTAGGLVIGFNVRPDGNAQRLSKEKGIEIKTYNIIYNLVDDIKKALSGLLSPDVIEKDLGRAEVREVFSIPKIGVIAGCSVLDGKILRHALVRLVREGRLVYGGQISSLKRFKDDAKEVASGYECGIGIENYNDIKVGDIIEAYAKEEVVRELE